MRAKVGEAKRVFKAEKVKAEEERRDESQNPVKSTA